MRKPRGACSFLGCLKAAEGLSPHLGPDAADAVACEVVGDIQSVYILVSKVEVDAARADLAAMDVPGLFSTNATKGPQ